MCLLEYNDGILVEISILIKKNLSQDLLPKKYWKSNLTSPFFGHSYNAAGTIYKIFGPKYVQLYKGLDTSGYWHWWTIDKDNRIIDLTSEHYTSKNKILPYAEGQKSSVLGQNYKKRILRLTDRVMYEYENCNNNGSTLRC
jgi:hypothetical protein